MDGGIDTLSAPTREADGPQLPDYLVKTYTWAYLKPSSLFLLDNTFVVTAILWGNLRRLIRANCAELAAGQRVLQAASVYGRYSVDLANRLGPSGRLDVIDIAPLQVAHCRRKLAGFPQAKVRLADAAAPGSGRYDVVCCFFLLHEIPDDHKRQVVDALLAAVPPGGKVVFTDYHRARRWHPLRWPMHLVFRWLEPFALGLIRREIDDFAGDRDAFVWRKSTFFGGLYQKVVAERRLHPAQISRAAR
jgi:SAM-dependent methyltransferase